MFGKYFESTFTGSMFGVGAIKHATWAYVIANWIPDKKMGAIVELNPRHVAACIGEDVEPIKAAIEWLCQPDGDSRTKLEEGRRLIRIGEFDYQVVNGEKYRQIRDEETRREQNRSAQATFRSKLPKRTPFARHPLPVNGKDGIM